MIDSDGTWYAFPNHHCTANDGCWNDRPVGLPPLGTETEPQNSVHRHVVAINPSRDISLDRRVWSTLVSCWAMMGSVRLAVGLVDDAVRLAVGAEHVEHAELIDAALDETIEPDDAMIEKNLDHDIFLDRME